MERGCWSSILRNIAETLTLSILDEMLCWQSVQTTLVSRNKLLSSVSRRGSSLMSRLALTAKTHKPVMEFRNLHLSSSWCFAALAKFVGNVSSRQFHVQIHDGDLMGKLVRSLVSCPYMRRQPTAEILAAMDRLAKRTYASHKFACLGLQPRRPILSLVSAAARVPA